MQYERITDEKPKNWGGAIHRTFSPGANGIQMLLHSGGIPRGEESSKGNSGVFDSNVKSSP